MALVEPPHRSAATLDTGSRHCRDDLTERHVGLLDDEPEQKMHISSSGETLPPLGFASMLPVSLQRCIQITTTLGLIP
jgi:hypothetical protein